MRWLARMDSNQATLLRASICRNQLMNGFELAKMWATTCKLLIYGFYKQHPTTVVEPQCHLGLMEVCRCAAA